MHRLEKNYHLIYFSQKSTGRITIHFVYLNHVSESTCGQFSYRTLDGVFKPFLLFFKPFPDTPAIGHRLTQRPVFNTAHVEQQWFNF
jgi:hypothetical protein